MNSFLGGFRFDCDMTAPNFERTKPSVWELGFSAVKKGKTDKNCDWESLINHESHVVLFDWRMMAKDQITTTG